MAGHHGPAGRSEDVANKKEVGHRDRGSSLLGAQPPRRPSFRHLTPNLTGWSPPRTLRLLHGGCPPEHAHRHEIEPDPMTLTVGSIFGSRTQTRQERSLSIIPGPRTVTMEL